MPARRDEPPTAGRTQRQPPALHVGAGSAGRPVGPGRDRTGPAAGGGGVITGYRLEVDPAALGLPVTALVRVRPGPGQLTRVAQTAEETPQVVECYRITGEDCFLLKVHAPSIGALEEVLDRFLLFGQTTTSIVVSTPVAPRSLPLPGPATG